MLKIQFKICLSLILLIVELKFSKLDVLSNKFTVIQIQEAFDRKNYYLCAICLLYFSSTKNY